ncbi:hypothetical protein TELCIR_12458 [Teladorsagia circumcincta]|uniref:Uncharacterized protein n=1 Tax=Teladorsagia circumcincta TaxID=45464 RepID=A0A2G9U6F4_TELCI|nr:hypothetical protein TELCIR_12458 [Teladorsagia circumcincta]
MGLREYCRANTDPGDRIRFELTTVFFKCAPTCEEFVENVLSVHNPLQGVLKIELTTRLAVVKVESGSIK